MMPNTFSAGQLLPKSPQLNLENVQWTETLGVGSPWAFPRPVPGLSEGLLFPSQPLLAHVEQTCQPHGAKVKLKLQVHRWRCRNRRCAVHFFTASLDGVASGAARRAPSA